MVYDHSLEVNMIDILLIHQHSINILEILSRLMIWFLRFKGRFVVIGETLSSTHAWYCTELTSDVE
jgi:hypothetical protein